MAGFSILAKLGLDSSTFASGLKKQDTAMSKFGAAIGTAVKAGAVVAGAAFAAFTIKGIKDLVDFDTKMGEVFTLLPGITEESMGKMKDSVRSLATTMGVDLGDATAALYQAISAGVPEENVFDFMEIASKAAIGGVTSLETAVDGITTAMNTYGAANLSAQDASDAMFTAVKLGKTTFEELSDALFNVLPMAQQAGVSFDTISAALAVMTSKGTPTTVATTQLRAALTALIAPTAKTAKAFNDYGLDVGNLKALLAGGDDGLVKAMQNVLVATEGDETAIRKLLGSTEAMNAVFTLTSGNAKSMGDALEEMANKTGATDTAFQTMEKTVGHQIDLMMGSLKNLGISVGNVFLPMINDILPDLIKAFNNAVGPVDEFAKKFPGMVRDVGALVGKFIKFGTILTTWIVTARVASALMGAWTVATNLFKTSTVGATAAVIKLNTASKANVIGLVVAAAAAASMAMKDWMDSEEALHKVMKTSPEVIRKAAKAAEDAGKDYEDAKDRVQRLTEELKELNRQEGLKAQGITQLQDALALRKESLEVLKEDQALQLKNRERLEAGLKLKKLALEEELKSASSEFHRQLVIEDINALMAQQKTLVGDTLQFQKDIKVTENDILDIEKDRNKEIKDAKQVQLDTKKIIDDVHRVKKLEKTEVGKIHLLELGIRDLEIQKKNLIDNSLVSRNLETTAAKDLETVEGNILAKREAIELIIKGALKRAQDAELLRMKDLVAEFDKAVAAQIILRDKAKEAAEAKEAEVAAFRKDLEAAEAALEPLKKFFQKDFKGKITPNYAEMHREFKKLKAEGKLPPNTETLNDFKQMLTDQAVAAKTARDNILEDGAAALAAANDEREKEAAANKLIDEGKKKITDEKERILKLEEEFADKEKKTLEQLTAEREAWQKSLKDWEEKLNLIPPAEKTLANALNNLSPPLASIDAGIAALNAKDFGGGEGGGDGDGAGGSGGSETHEHNITVNVEGAGGGGGGDDDIPLPPLPLPGDNKNEEDSGTEVELPAPAEGGDAGTEVDLPAPGEDGGDGTDVELPAPGGDGGEDGEVKIPTPGDEEGGGSLSLEATQKDVLYALQGFFVNQ